MDTCSVLFHSDGRCAIGPYVIRGHYDVEDANAQLFDPLRVIALAEAFDKHHEHELAFLEPRHVDPQTNDGISLHADVAHQVKDIPRQVIACVHGRFKHDHLHADWHVADDEGQDNFKKCLCGGKLPLTYWYHPCTFGVLVLCARPVRHCVDAPFVFACDFQHVEIGDGNDCLTCDHESN